MQVDDEASLWRGLQLLMDAQAFLAGLVRGGEGGSEVARSTVTDLLPLQLAVDDYLAREDDLLPLSLRLYGIEPDLFGHALEHTFAVYDGLVEGLAALAPELEVGHVLQVESVLPASHRITLRFDVASLGKDAPRCVSAWTELMVALTWCADPQRSDDALAEVLPSRARREAAVRAALRIAPRPGGDVQAIELRGTLCPRGHRFQLTTMERPAVEAAVRRLEAA